MAVYLAVMGAAYLAVVARAGSLDKRWVIGTVVVAHVLFLLGPPLMSTDVFNYVDYARLAVLHHLSPYSHVPAEAPQDALYRFVHWRHTHAAYGPLFILGTYPLGFLSPAAAVWTLKTVAAVCSLGCAALLWRLAGRSERAPVVVLAVFGLNPLLLVWGVGGAHNDLLMLLFMLGGVVLLAEKRWAAGGVGLVVAAAIKATAGLALVFAFVGSAERRRLLRGVIPAALAMSVIAVLAFPDHTVGLFRVLHHEQGIVSHGACRFMSPYCSGATT